jgi:hypothetical protein
MKLLFISLACLTLFGCDKKVVTEYTSKGELVTKEVNMITHTFNHLICRDGVLYISNNNKLSPYVVLDKDNNMKGVPCKER